VRGEGRKKVISSVGETPGEWMMGISWKNGVKSVGQFTELEERRREAKTRLLNGRLGVLFLPWSGRFMVKEWGRIWYPY